MLSWWRHAAPPGAELRAVLAFDTDALVGVAPWYVLNRQGIAEYGLLASSAAGGVEPLAKASREAECAQAFIARIAANRPAPSVIALSQIRRGSAWPQLLRDNWPGSRPLLMREQPVSAPFIDRDGMTFEQYFAGRSSNFRAECRRHRRKFEEIGMIERLAGPGAEAERDLRHFADLHYSRWEPRGGTGALRPALERMLLSAAEKLVEPGRLRIVALDVGDEPASVQLFVAAGGTVAYWLGGFDERWAQFGPGNLALLAAVRDFFTRGEERFDLGPGAQPYKYRFATGEDELATVVIIPRGTRLPLAVGAQAARRSRRALSRRFPGARSAWRRLKGRFVRRSR
jgi:hypothetical protein